MSLESLPSCLGEDGPRKTKINWRMSKTSCNRAGRTLSTSCSSSRNVWERDSVYSVELITFDVLSRDFRLGSNFATLDGLYWDQLFDKKEKQATSHTIRIAEIYKVRGERAFPQRRVRLQALQQSSMSGVSAASQEAIVPTLVVELRPDIVPL